MKVILNVLPRFFFIPQAYVNEPMPVPVVFLESPAPVNEDRFQHVTISSVETAAKVFGGSTTEAKEKQESSNVVSLFKKT